MTDNNPFAPQATAAQTREEKLRQEQDSKREYESQRAAAIQQQRERDAIRAKIHAQLERVRQGLVASVGQEFNKNPRKPWSASRILAAGEYVVYLTRDYATGRNYLTPEIAAYDAGVIRDKFVWGLVSANARGGVKIPDGALVGQHEDWFPELLERKQAEYARFIQRRQAEKAQAATPEIDEPSEDSEVEVTSEPEPSGQAIELTPEKIGELAAAFQVSTKVRRQKLVASH